MTTWRIDPDTYALVIDEPPVSGAYTLAEISAIARPPCPICGTPIHVDAVDISSSDTGPGAIYLPGAMSCPNGCDPHTGRRERAEQQAAAYTITVNPGRGGTVVPVDDTGTAIAALHDMAIGEVLTIRRTR